MAFSLQGVADVHFAGELIPYVEQNEFRHPTPNTVCQLSTNQGRVYIQRAYVKIRKDREVRLTCECTTG